MTPERRAVEQWLGISLDETHRMRASDVRCIALRTCWSSGG
jgi:hypothetical protein